MNQEVNLNNKRKRLKLYYGLLITVVCIIGVSFAWFRLYLSQSEDNTLASRTCFSTTLTEDTSKITLTDAFPISDEDGLKQTPFTFTLKNNCDSYVKVYVTIDSTYRESTSSSYLSDNYMRVSILPSGSNGGSSILLGKQTLTNLENNRKGYIIINTGLGANEEKSYDLRIWMDSATTLEQGLNKNWAGKIVVVSNASNVPPTLKDAVLANNEIKTPLTTPGAEASLYTLDDALALLPNYVQGWEKEYYVTYGTGWEASGDKFNLTGTAVTSDTYANSYDTLIGKYLSSIYIQHVGSSTAGKMMTTTDLDILYYIVDATEDTITGKFITSNKNITEALLASTEDDYGTSYYFRGSVKNNYVEFANKCWRIVRITGDGSVKIVLHNNNETNSSNPCSASNNSVAAAVFDGSNFNDSRDDNAYVGLKYGTAGSSDYTSTHSNVNNSLLFSELETWYARNLSIFGNKIADTIWCTDKTVISDTSYDPFEYENVTGLGYGSGTTYYGIVQRLLSANNTAGGTGPTLKCSGDLSKVTNKIGALSGDELAFAGYLLHGNNTGVYLQENAVVEYWSLTPFLFNGDSSFALVAGGVNGWFEDAYIDNGFGVRPAIALKDDVTISGGTGTSEDPYIVN